MSSNAAHATSLDEFLAWERAQDCKHEFDGHRPVAMNGVTLRHRWTADDLARALETRVTGRGCSTLAGDVKIIVAGRVRYPDVVVTCAEADGAADIVPEPVLVVEVASPSTARTDRILKLEEYRLTPSIQHYLLLEQDSPEGILFTRQGDRWLAEVVAAPGDVAFVALDLTVPMAEIYRRALPAAAG